MTNKNNIYFASDVHLGTPNHQESLIREKIFVKWLDEIKQDAKEIYLLGDIFDFWYEYKHVAPRGFTRTLGKIAEITDNGIPVHFFTGNHDLWVFDYLTQETGVILHRNKLVTEFYGKKFLLAHGDGLGPGDKGFKRMKKVFTNPVAQWLFSRLHPNFAFGIAKGWSQKSRESYSKNEMEFKGEDGEWLILYAKHKLKTQHFDYFIFGHRHIPIDITINNTTRFINLGDWLHNFTYAVFDGTKLELKRYNNK